jgi:hypothetical protein
MIVDGVEILPRDYKVLKQYYEITDELYNKCKVKLVKCKDILERAAEEIENCYGRNTELTLNIHELLEELDHVS